MNDQHAYLRFAADAMRRRSAIWSAAASRIRARPSTSGASLFTVDDDYRVTGAIRTFF